MACELSALFNNISMLIKNIAPSSSQVDSSAREIVFCTDHSRQVINQITQGAQELAAEAVRQLAGEQGRGFAAVADEVRKLAEQSSRAAREIAGLISQIQKDTVKAINSMEANTGIVQRESLVIEDGAAIFQQIEQSVTQVTSQVQEVSASTEQLAQSSENIILAMKSVRKIAEQIAASTQSMAAGAQEQLDSLEVMAAATITLNQLGTELQETMARFSLSRSEEFDAAGRVAKIEHRGRRIVRLDFSDCNKRQLIDVTEAAKTKIKEEEQGCVFTLSVFRNIHFDSEVVDAFKSLTEHNKPYVKAGAVVGVTGLQKIVYNA